ncbi:MAG: glucosyltransferase domain-containing protein [Fibromonadaceae bacterium]|jgi:hypothetical protein|nr:glucosyltransferase domain-containing protein [Fibromonadaceae bacterium]
MENPSLKNFCDFCKNNIPLLVATALALFFCYGIKLFQYSIGLDSEGIMMSDRHSVFKLFTNIGRFGLDLLIWMLNINGFNPFTAFFSAFCLIWLFTISHAYIIALFCKNTGNNNALIPFALVFASSPIWAEQFYFVFQAREVALMVLLCPYTIYIMFRGFIDNKKSKIIFAFFALIFMTSVYQAMVPFFCCGVFICFMIFLETSDYKAKFYRNLCLKIFTMLVCAIVVYTIIDRILIPYILNIEKAQYFDDFNKWGHTSIKENILRILLFAYTLTIGCIPQIQDIVNPIIALNAGMENAKRVADMSKSFGNILLLPLALLFIIKSIDIARKKIASDKKILYIIASIGIPLSIMFLALIGGNKPPIRAIYVFPLAFAFMFFFLIKNYSNKYRIAVACFALFTTAYQAQITAQLLYSDQLRYNEDVRLAYEIRDVIVKTSLDNENLPVAIIGRARTSEKFHTNANFIQGEVIGYSVFEFGWNRGEVPERVINFMRCLGINFNMPNGEQMEKAIYESTYMPSYPNSGFVKKLPDVIVVKLSDFNH